MNDVVAEFRSKSRNGYAGKTDDELILAIGDKFPDYLTNEVFRIDYLKAKKPELFKNPMVERAVRENPDGPAYEATEEQRDKFRATMDAPMGSIRAQLFSGPPAPKESPSLERAVTGAAMQSARNLYGLGSDTPTPKKVLTGIGLETGAGIAGLGKFLGGVIESPLSSGVIEQGFNLAEGITGRNLTPELFRKMFQGVKDDGKKLGQASAKNAKELSELHEVVNPDLASRVPGLVVGAAVSSLPSIAAAPLGPGGVLGAAALQSFGSTYQEATDAYEKSGMSREEARQKAFVPSMASGAITGAMVKVFGGMEKFLGQLGAGKLAEAGTKALIKGALKAAGMEFPEEGFDQLWQGMLARISFNPDKPMLDVWQESLTAAALGAGAGLLVGGATITGNTAIKNFFKQAEQPQPPATGEASEEAISKDPDQTTEGQTSESWISNEGEEEQVAPVARGPKVLPSRTPNPFQPVAEPTTPADVLRDIWGVPQATPVAVQATLPSARQAQRRAGLEAGLTVDQPPLEELPPDPPREGQYPLPVGQYPETGLPEGDLPTTALVAPVAPKVAPVLEPALDRLVNAVQTVAKRKDADPELVQGALNAAPNAVRVLEGHIGRLEQDGFTSEAEAAYKKLVAIDKFVRSKQPKEAKPPPPIRAKPKKVAKAKVAPAPAPVAPVVAPVAPTPAAPPVSPVVVTGLRERLAQLEKEKAEKAKREAPAPHVNVVTSADPAGTTSLRSQLSQKPSTTAPKVTPISKPKVQPLAKKPRVVPIEDADVELERRGVAAPAVTPVVTPTTEPKVTIKKGKDFETEGVWEVTVGDKTSRIFYDKQSYSWWDLGKSLRPGSMEGFLGYNRTEAIAKLREQHNAPAKPKAAAPKATPKPATTPKGKTVQDVNKGIAQRKVKEAEQVPIPKGKSTLEPLPQGQEPGTKTSGLTWQSVSAGTRDRKLTKYKGYDLDVVAVPEGVVWRIMRGDTEETGFERNAAATEVAEQLANRVDKLSANEPLPPDVTAAFEARRSNFNKKTSQKNLDAALKKHGLDELAAQKRWLGLDVNPAFGYGSGLGGEFLTHKIQDGVGGAKTNLKVLLGFLAENGTNVAVRKMAQALAKFADLQTLDVHVDLYGDRSFYSPSGRTISLNGVSGKIRESTIIHEAIHALTSNYIYEHVDDERAFGKGLKASLERTLKNKDAPKEIKQLISLYLRAIESQGLTKRLFEGVEVADDKVIEERINIYGGELGYRWGRIPVGVDYKTWGYLLETNNELRDAGFKIEKLDGELGELVISVDEPKIALLRKLGFLTQHEEGTGTNRRDVLGVKIPVTVKRFLPPLASTGTGAARTANAGIPYGFANLDEFLAEAFSNPRFQERLNGIPSSEPGKSLWSQFIDFLKDLFPYFKTNGTALTELLAIGESIMAQDVSAMGKKGETSYSLESALATLRATQRGADPDEIANATENLRKEQAAALTANMPVVQDWVDQQQSMIEQGNVKGSVNLTGAALTRHKIVQAIVGNRIIKQFLISPVLQLEESSKALNGAVTNFNQLLDDPNSTPQIISNAAREAANFLDAFYSRLLSFREAQARKTRLLLADKNQLIAEMDEAVDATKISRALLDDFKSIVKSMVDVTNDQAANEATRNAKRNESGARSILKFVATHAHMSTILINNGTIKTVDDVVTLINGAATARLTPTNNSIDDVMGGNQDSVRAVAHYLLKSKALRDRIDAANALINSTATRVPLSGFKTKLKDLIDKGHIRQAINLFASGYGKTSVELAATRSVAQVAGHKIQKILIDVEALGEVRLILDGLEQSPEFREQAKAIYDRVAVEEQIRTIDGNQWVLKPIYFGDKPIRISSQGAKSKEEMKALNDWWQRAMWYAKVDKQHPEWDPAKAAAIEAFADNIGIELNSSYSAEAGHLLESLPRAVIRKTFGIIWKVDRIPKFILRSTAGYASDMAFRAQNAYSTAAEQVIAIHKRFGAQLTLKLKAALKSHGMDERDYEDKVYTQLSASLQDFNNPKRLGVGSVTPGGHEITSEDWTYFQAVRSFEKMVIDAVNGTADKSFQSIQIQPTGIVIRRNGKIAFRLPMETGPGTVHRRLTSIIEWHQRWSTSNTAARVKFLNRNLDRILISYVSDSTNPTFNSDYAFRNEFKTILREEPITNFDDLVQRTYLLALQHQIDESEGDVEVPITPQQVAATILGEIDNNFQRWKTLNPEREANQKSIFSAWGGEQSFNTERGQQIVPSGWYDYGFVGFGERMGFLHNARSGFAIQLHTSIGALVTALKNEVQSFEDRKTDKETGIQSKSRQAQIDGDEYYNWREAKVLLEEVSNYHNQLDAALRYEMTKEARAGFEDMGVDPNTWLQLTISSLLINPTTQVFNAMGGATRLMLLDMVIRNKSAAAELASAGPGAIMTVWREALRLFTNDKTAASRAIYNSLSHASVAPIVGKVAEAIMTQAKNLRAVDLLKTELGLTLNVDLLNTIMAEWAMWKQGGMPGTEAVEGVALAPAMLNMAARVSSEVMRQGSVGFVDDRINSRAIALVNEWTLDMESRARDFGEMRFRRAREDRRDPFDTLDIRNRFTDQELVGGRFTSPGPAAIRTRQFLSREGGVNIDHAWWDYYERWRAAPEDQKNHIRMFGESTRHQIILAVSSTVNQSTFDNRPISLRTRREFSTLGIFKGYAANAMYELSAMSDRESRKSLPEGTIRNLPAAIMTTVVLTAMGAMAVWLNDEMRKRIFGWFNNVPTVFDNQIRSSLVKSILMSYASQSPFYGWMANIATGRTFKHGFDFNSMFLVLNQAMDIAGAFKESLQTGNPIRPIVRLLTRWTPTKYLPVPITSGLTEVNQVTNLLARGARQAGLDISIHKYGSFNPTEAQYSKVHSPVNDYWNAIGNRKQDDAIEAFQAIRAEYAKDGRGDADQKAWSSIEARHPISKAFVGKITSEELNMILERLTEKERGVIEGTLGFFDQVRAVIKPIGARPYQRFMDERVISPGGRGGINPIPREFRDSREMFSPQREMRELEGSTRDMF